MRSSHQPTVGDPYRAVVLVLAAAAFAGMLLTAVSGFLLGNPVVVDAAVSLLLATGVLVGVSLAQTARARPPKIPVSVLSSEAQVAIAVATAPVTVAALEPFERPDLEASTREPTGPAAPPRFAGWLAVLLNAALWTRDSFHKLMEMGTVSVQIAIVGAVGVLFMLLVEFLAEVLTWQSAAVGVMAALAGAGLAATAARYLGGIDAGQLPEGPFLLRGARVTAWVLVTAAFAIVLQWAAQLTALHMLHRLMLVLNAIVCYELFNAKPVSQPVEIFPLDFGVLSALGRRPNIVASVLDSAEQQLGIDLRSTWALAVARRSLEPIVVGLGIVGWLSTSLTVIGMEEQGVVERLGVPVAQAPLSPGLHVHWPWPIDRVHRIPVARVQVLTIGHEGEERGGPEDVLWARQHAANEYTLLLGNGRDLITVDAAIQFRIADARAWQYHTQNPADALRAIGYRAVMRTTVSRTLADALSENVVATTARMRQMVQDDANALGLGVDVLGFTVGGMHPPVAVASDYQAVVSAELGKVTAVVNAEAYRNRTVPAAEVSVLTGLNTARADGVETMAKATGEAWSFLTIQAQYLASPQEFLFRRRLETFEKNLAGRRFTIVDARFLRDGGELWMTP
jgi:regulator of protease activity HflC (stomatin/prohibitin superfamily)